MLEWYKENMHVGTVRESRFLAGLEKSELVQIISRFEKSGVKLQCLIGEGNLGLLRIIGNFKKLRIREIRIPQ